MHLPREYDHQRVIEYDLPGNWRVVVGKTARDNDWLSIKFAQPQDWWFHVQSLPGSHTLLLARETLDPDRDTLYLAAKLAAYHSKARSAGVVPVSYTRAAYVTKPKGAKDGTVKIRKESVLKVRPTTPDEAATMTVHYPKQRKQISRHLHDQTKP
tara:strand:- start:4477 stop:4941 length:465 start_codon:yes stop_codon:yes gene_type:complete